MSRSWSGEGFHRRKAFRSGRWRFRGRGLRQKMGIRKLGRWLRRSGRGEHAQRSILPKRVSKRPWKRDIQGFSGILPILRKSTILAQVISGSQRSRGPGAETFQQSHPPAFEPIVRPDFTNYGDCKTCRERTANAKSRLTALRRIIARRFRYSRRRADQTN